MLKRFRSIPGSIVAVLALATLSMAAPVLADPPGRVVRLAYMSGDISFQAAGDGERWSEASLNRPLVPGDGLYADRASRVEMEVGAASVRLDERSNFRVLNLDDSFAQMELTEGVLNLRVRRVFEGDRYEIDTPTLAFVIDRAGSYRVDIAPDGLSTMVTVFEGGGVVYGEGNASMAVDAGGSYRFNDSRLRDVDSRGLPRGDDFDQWCLERDDRYERSVTRRYVSEEVIGYADLDDYGSWSTVETYGSVWFPTRVDVGWAPYRHGRWMWVDPWGWSWVDRSPWGFAPYHYGRWCQVGTRWGWIPGPRHLRPVYAPALVAFVGGHHFGVGINVGGPVGWFPLGPRDVYVPWYRGSRNYFNNINVRNTTIINNVHITNVYNNYSNGRPIDNFNYAYRNNERAYSVVSREDFIGARPVDRNLLRVDRAQLGRGQVLSRVDVKPVAASFRGGNEIANRTRLPSVDVARRAVVARTEPARPVEVQGRLRAIERNGNQPLAISQMREIATRAPEGPARSERVRVIGTQGEGPRAAQPQPTREPVTRSGAAGQEGRAPRQAVTPRDSAPAGNARQPIQAEDRRLPSSGYAPGRSAVDRDQRAAPVRSSTPAAESRAPRSVERAPSTIRAPERQPIERTTQPARSAAPVVRETPQPRQVQPQQAPQRIERSAPVRQAPQPQPQRAAPQRIERSAPQPVQRSAPQPVQRSAPQPVQRSAPQPAQRSAPQPAQRSAPQPAQRSAPQPQPRQQRAPAQNKESNDGNNERKRRND